MDQWRFGIWEGNNIRIGIVVQVFQINLVEVPIGAKDISELPELTAFPFDDFFNPGVLLFRMGRHKTCIFIVKGNTCFQFSICIERPVRSH